MSTDRHYADRVVKLTDLVSVDGVLEDFTFTNCHVTGPAVLISQDSTVMNCNLGGPDADALLWEIPVTRQRIVGAVLAKHCFFEGCSFFNVGFAGPPEMIKEIRDAAA